MFWRELAGLLLAVFLLGGLSASQEAPDDASVADPPAAGVAAGVAADKQQLRVNWLYGPYVPREAPLLPLDIRLRAKLFQLQTFTTPGIYIRSSFISMIDQATSTPYEWGGGFGGYGRRLISNYSRFAIQNVFSTTGNAALGYEPRYDRCHCDGFGPRTRHALLRNFMTYNRTEQELRPQIAFYGAALGAGMISSVWTPESKLWRAGYEGVITQAGFGMLSNWIGEFAPDLRRRFLHENSGEANQR